MRWLERYLTESSPRLEHFAEIAASLAEREFEVGRAELTDPRRALTLRPAVHGDLSEARDDLRGPGQA